MGIPLFSALGNLGAQWGQAKEETAQENLRTQQIAAQLKRQDAMEQLARQRQVSEEERISIDKQRLAQTMAEQKQKAEDYYQEGWDPKNALTMKDPDNPSMYLVKNLRARQGQEFTRRVPKGQGYMTWEEQEALKREPVGYQFFETGPQRKIVGISKEDPTKHVDTGEFQTPPPASVAAAAAPGQLAQTAEDAGQNVLNGMAFQTATANLGKGGKQATMHWLRQHGYIPPPAPTKANQDAVSALMGLSPTVDSLAGVLTQPDPKNPGQPLYKDNSYSTRLRTVGSWAKYQAHMSPDDPMMQAFIPLASFVTVQGASPWTRIGRGKYIYDYIRAHLPDPIGGFTPAGMWTRVQQIQLMLKQQLPLLRYEALGGIRQPNGSIKPIGEFNPYSIEGEPAKGTSTETPSFNPSDYPDPSAPPPPR